MSQIGFYKAHDKFGFCSNFYESPIVIDNVLYKTTEHYYQSKKFEMGSVLWKQIVESSTPQEVVNLARNNPVPENWNEIKFQVMRVAIYNKFFQHPNLAKLLVNTEDNYLVENTVDTVRPDEWWGNGKEGGGRNWLGKILMEVREVLKEDKTSI